MSIVDSDDLVKIKNELVKEKPLIACNIWAYIKDLEARIKKLEEVRK